MTKKTVRSKATRTKELPYARSTKPRKPAKKARPASSDPVALTAKDAVHDAIGGLEAARRAFDQMRVYQFRGKGDLAYFEDIVFHEELERVHNWLVRLDIYLPENVEIGQ